MNIFRSHMVHRLARIVQVKLPVEAEILFDKGLRAPGGGKQMVWGIAAQFTVPSHGDVHPESGIVLISKEAETAITMPHLRADILRGRRVPSDELFNAAYELAQIEYRASHGDIDLSDILCINRNHIPAVPMFSGGPLQ